MMYYVVLGCVVLCYVVSSGVVVWCVALCCVVVRCVVVWCGVVCCAVLRRVVLCWKRKMQKENTGWLAGAA